MNKPQIRLAIVVITLLLWIALNYIGFRITIMPGAGIRYLIVPLIVLVLVLYLGIRYIHSAYQFSSFRQGMRYFLACLFGIDSPVLVIGDGKVLGSGPDENLILKVGGPGTLKVGEGNVVLVENFSGKVRILGRGKYFLSRNETVKDFTSLDERYRLIEKLTARSKDGIEVLAREIRYRYQVAGEDAPGVRTKPDDRFQYSDEAIIKMVYNREITETGGGSWEDGVNHVVESIIIDFIQTHPVDYLTAPKSQDADPRSEIYEQFFSSDGENKFLERGAKLVWIDIGHFETPEKVVAEQRVYTWQARLQGSANMERAIGEAQRTAYQEMGRAEAQAEILINILNSLEAVGTPGETRQNIRALYLARIAQLLDAMGEQPQLSSSNLGSGE